MLGGRIIMLSVFTYETIKSLNTLEFEVYSYIVKNTEKIDKMTIRELASETHVSTTIIMQFCKKMNCNGWSEFKIRLKMSKASNLEPVSQFETLINFDYLNKLQSEAFINDIEKAANLICDAQIVFLIGAGTSGILAKYASKHFSDMGKFCAFNDEVFFPIPQGDYSNYAIVVLSVSGETPSMISQVARFKDLNASVISLTNTLNNPLASMADIALSYNIPPVFVNPNHLQKVDATPQLPVIFIIESLGKTIYNLLNSDEIAH